MDSLDQHRKYYNERWLNRNYINAFKLARCRAILDALAALELAEPRIVDLGCGTGWLSCMLGLIGPTSGVDLSDTAIDKAKKRYPHVEFIQADILNWRHPQEAFDVVVSQEVIEHVPDQERYLSIAHDLLRPNGFLILTTPNAKTFSAMPEAQRKNWSKQPIENWLTIKDLKSLVRRHFELKHVSTIIPGYGSKGLYRIVNSARLRHLLTKAGVYPVFSGLHQFFKLGLHIVLTAQRL
jgi:2-polyprenyl-3-methyl-5-hydroxy-6-metoxy-1,4-benzoquinol methylase